MSSSGFGEGDSGLLAYKDSAQNWKDLKELGLKFEYSCCHSLGLWYETYKKDVVTACSIFEETCLKKNVTESCLKYAFLKIKGGGGILREPNKSFEALDHGCKVIKDAKCCQAAGQQLAEGVVGHGPSPSVAKEYFQKGCDMKLSSSCFHLGAIYMLLYNTKKLQEDELLQCRDKAISAWEKGCILGHPISCMNMAKAHTKGDGVEKSDKIASKYREMYEAASKNSPNIGV